MNEGRKHNEIYSMPVMAPTISTHFMLYSLRSQIICWASHIPTISECWFYCIKKKKKTKWIIAAYFHSAEHLCATFKVSLCLIHIRLSFYRPGQTLTASGCWGSHNFYTINTQSGKVVNLMHQPPLLPGDIAGTLFCQRLSQLQGHNSAGRIRSMKIPMTPLEIEPMSFQLIVQWFKSHMQEKILAYLCKDSNRYLTGLTLAHSTLQPVKWWNQQWMQQNSPQHNIIFLHFWSTTWETEILHTSSRTPHVGTEVSTSSLQDLHPNSCASGSWHGSGS